MAAHARECPPSGADRWMFCTASVPLILRLMDAGELKESDLEGDEQIDEETLLETGIGQYADVVFDLDAPDSFSAEGTVMHSIRQMCLEFGTDPFDYVGLQMQEAGFRFTIDEAMADRLVPGIDWIRSMTDKPDVEIRVDLSSWLPDQFGTSDCGFIVDRTLFKSDYKNGIGKPVAAEGNRQLRLYALGYWDMMGRPDIDKVVLNIDQPRAGGMKFWECSFGELMQFGEEVRRVYQRIKKGDVEFVPTTNGCQFCPVRKTERGCAAYNRWMLMLFGSTFFDPSQGDPVFKDPAQISKAQRWYIVKHAAAARAWLAKLHDASRQAAIDGDPDPGSKAIEGDAGNRFFTKPKVAERILVRSLGAAAYKPRQVIGITEIERLLKPGRKKQGDPVAWDALQALVDRPAGQPKLVPADHPKPAYVQDYGDEFDDLD